MNVDAEKRKDLTVTLILKDSKGNTLVAQLLSCLFIVYQKSMNQEDIYFTEATFYFVFYKKLYYYVLCELISTAHYVSLSNQKQRVGDM